MGLVHLKSVLHPGESVSLHPGFVVSLSGFVCLFVWFDCLYMFVFFLFFKFQLEVGHRKMFCI